MSNWTVDSVWYQLAGVLDAIFVSYIGLLYFTNSTLYACKHHAHTQRQLTLSADRERQRQLNGYREKPQSDDEFSTETHCLL